MIAKINPFLRNKYKMRYSEFENDENPTSFDELPDSSAIKKLLPQIVSAAQKQYDRWEIVDNDEIGFQDEFAGGGICHLIADEISGILHSAGIPCQSVSSNYEQHVYCVAQCSDGIFEIDVPYHNYETGGGFTWKRIDGIVFDESYVTVSRLDGDPASYDNYVDLN
jgi:hypothetical protein